MTMGEHRDFCKTMYHWFSELIDIYNQRHGEPVPMELIDVTAHAGEQAGIDPDELNALYLHALDKGSTIP